jgi:hypothetical protein
VSEKVDEWETLSHLIALTTATAYLLNDHPQSLMLVGAPGQGKSRLLSRFDHLDTVLRLSDVTSDPLRRKVLPMMVKEGKRHIILPEFNKLLQRRDSTAENTAGVISLAMSGEMHGAMIGPDEFKDIPADFRVGVIAGMTQRVFDLWHGKAENSGLLDRFMVIPVNFSLETKRRIETAIWNKDDSMVLPYEFKRKLEPTAIRMTPSVQLMGRALVEEVTISSAGNRTRFIQFVRAIMSASALVRGSNKVTKEDVAITSKLFHALKRKVAKA